MHGLPMAHVNNTSCDLQRRGVLSFGLLSAFALTSALPAVVYAREDNHYRYLFELPITAASFDKESLESASTLRLELQHARPDRLVRQLESLGLDASQVRADALHVVVARQQVLHNNRTQARHRQPSFVLDYDQPIVDAELTALRRNKAAGIDALRDRVANRITTKSYQRSFDIASRVLATGEGDCTEHAVLLATLSRGLDLPARVIIGVVVLGLDSGVAAFGHAWTEIYQEGRWHLVDATSVGDDPSAFYLPVGELSNEGPGYAMDLLRITMNYPAHVRLLDATPQ